MLDLFGWLVRRSGSMGIGSRRERQSKRCAQTEQSPHPLSPQWFGKRGCDTHRRSCVGRISQDTIPAYIPRGNAQGLRWQRQMAPKPEEL